MYNQFEYSSISWTIIIIVVVIIIIIIIIVILLFDVSTTLLQCTAQSLLIHLVSGLALLLTSAYLCGGILSSMSPCHRPSQFLLKLARSFICNGMGYHTSPSSAITPPRVVLYASLHSRKPGEPRTNSITSRCSANEPALLHRSLFSGRRGGPEKAAEIQPNCRHEND